MKNILFLILFISVVNCKGAKDSTDIILLKKENYFDKLTDGSFFSDVRCMQIKNKHALIYVGGGITKDSDPQLEWEETVNKTQTMMRVLLN